MRHWLARPSLRPFGGFRFGRVRRWTRATSGPVRQSAAGSRDPARIDDGMGAWVG